jgi:hypothetical protein
MSYDPATAFYAAELFQRRDTGLGEKIVLGAGTAAHPDGAGGQLRDELLNELLRVDTKWPKQPSRASL